jgi:hypothetical protein
MEDEMSCKEWDVDAEYTLECVLNPENCKLVDRIYIIDDDTKLPEKCIWEILHYIYCEPGLTYSFVDSIEIIIPFRAKGYYDSGRLYGPPEKCYPPEGDDERTLSGECQVYFYDEFSIRIGKCLLSRLASEQLFDLFEQKILEKDIGDLISDYQDGQY